MSEKEIKNLKREYKFGTKNYWKISLREMINSVWCYDNYSDINKQVYFRLSRIWLNCGRNKRNNN